MKPNYRAIEQAIGYRFRKKKNLELALTHPSFRYEKDDVSEDNQRLEYLGDAVLSLIAAEYLFTNNPDAKEGDMSKLRSFLTEDRKLAEIGRSINLGDFLRLGHGETLNGGSERASNLADAMEALIGAAWLDGETKAVKRIFNRVFLPVLEELQNGESSVGNSKGDLQEYAQRNGATIPVYRTVSVDGPEHDRRFTVSVTVCGKTGLAESTSRRKAEQLAAEKLLEMLTRE